MKKLILFSLFALAAIFLVPELSEAANFFTNSSLTNLAGSGSLITASFGIAAQAKQLEAEAEARLSSFAGKGNNYDGNAYDGNNYIGLDDDAVSFDGNGKSFLMELHSGLSFGFKITNGLTTTQVIALTPTILQTAANIAAYTGQTVDAVLTDGTIKTSVTGTSLNAKQKIDYLQKFIYNNPTRIVHMIISADTELQLEEQIVISNVSPLRSLENKVINISEYVGTDQLNTKKAEIPLALDFPEFQLDDQNVILIPVVPGTVKITWRIGGIRNNAAQLSTKAKKAYHNLHRSGALMVGR